MEQEVASLQRYSDTEHIAVQSFELQSPCRVSESNHRVLLVYSPLLDGPQVGGQSATILSVAAP